MELSDHIRETGRKVIDVTIEGRDWFFMITVFLCITLRFGLVAAGQTVLPLFILHSLSIVHNFGLHGHLRYSFQTSNLSYEVIWRNAIRARLGLLLLLLPVLLLSKSSLPVVLLGSLWLTARFVNEMLLAGARYNHRILDWVIIRTLLYIVIIIRIFYFTSVFHLESLLVTLAGSETVMGLLLLFARVSRFPVRILPGIDFTQLKLALPHFYAQLLFTFNYYLLLIPVAFTQQSLIIALFNFYLLLLATGLVPAYMIWNDYRNAKPHMNDSELTATTLALGIRGTFVSLLVVLTGIALHRHITGETPGLAIVIPLFTILISHFYTIPSLHLLTEEGKLYQLIKLWIAGMAMQMLVAFMIFSTGKPWLVFPAIALLSLVQSFAVFYLRRLRVVHEP